MRGREQNMDSWGPPHFQGAAEIQYTLRNIRRLHGSQGRGGKVRQAGNSPRHFQQDKPHGDEMRLMGKPGDPCYPVGIYDRRLDPFKNPRLTDSELQSHIYLLHLC